MFSNKPILDIMSIQKNVLIVNRKNNMFHAKSMKYLKSNKLLGLSDKRAKNKKNATMIILLSQAIHLRFLFAIMFGFIMFVLFGFLNAISKKRMVSSM